MFKYTLMLTLALSGSISAMEQNTQPNPDQRNSGGQFYQPGETATRTHPNLWLATKTTGGIAGGTIGFGTLAACMAFGEVVSSVTGGGATKPFAKRGLLLFSIAATPFIYGGWIGGSAVAKSLWYPTWFSIDKVKQLTNSGNK